MAAVTAIASSSAGSSGFPKPGLPEVPRQALVSHVPTAE
ncbi:hypothetical protein PC116_g8460 [Phytophthora cactorum]|nr:hypothetical protein Pcac1_g1584 [Phytophthora cactorum]KAG4243688.1 hypothetical protein PC116_g8460 [Phytophthora cactorum]